MIRKHFNDIKQIAVSLERIQQNEVPEKGHRGGPCLVGVRKLFVDVNGKLFPCERVSETSKAACIGHIDQGIDEKKALQLLNIEWITSENCRDCWARNLCDNCFTHADDGMGLSKEMQLTRCPENRAQKEESIKDYLVMHELGYRRELDT